MSSLRVRGGIKLSGEIRPQGAKNEALQVICATLLSESDITISNIPDIIDVNKLIEILRNLGVKITELEKGKYCFNAKNINLEYLNNGNFLDDAKSLRGSIMLVGPLLSRFGSASIPRPGGDKIGRRRLDTHFINLEKLGAKLEYNSNNRTYSIISKDPLKGTSILLDEASVTGTANIIMAAVLANGLTSIYNAACEPYIQQLCLLLNKMGAKISGIGSNLLSIDGVDKLDGATHQILPDMIEIGSWIGLAAMTQSELRIKDVSWENLGQIPDVFRK
ncbi:MAG: UDP-N-acetylglucosamine 1-carboxyvinyltransferase, partial [Cryomorphaceae bacterium]|nr:UDP-N-acetylglucosamine 1-carboxyvinyltransferase [Cryomorphaceae bacterium]